jgi:hypothetical protein
MTPLQTWKANNWKSDLRKYTRLFEQKFKHKSKGITTVGKVYAMRYSTSFIYETDKHHVTPVILSFGRFSDDNGVKYVRGLNLLYLKTNEIIDILEDSYKLLKYDDDKRIEPLLKIHSKYMIRFPYAFKNFEERRITCFSEVDECEWGMIPLLQKNLWGTFNPVALNEDFQKENTITTKKTKSKPINQIEEETEEEDLYEYEYDDDDIVDLDSE